VILSEPNQKATLKTQERKPMRRKRFQHGSLRKIKLGRQWKWVGKWYENREPKSKVLGACAHMTEGAAWTELNRILEPLNRNAGCALRRYTFGRGTKLSIRNRTPGASTKHSTTRSGRTGIPLARRL